MKTLKVSDLHVMDEVDMSALIERPEFLPFHFKGDETFLKSVIGQDAKITPLPSGRFMILMEMYFNVNTARHGSRVMRSGVFELVYTSKGACLTCYRHMGSLTPKNHLPLADWIDLPARWSGVVLFGGS